MRNTEAFYSLVLPLSRIPRCSAGRSRADKRRGRRVSQPPISRALLTRVTPLNVCLRAIHRLIVSN